MDNFSFHNPTKPIFGKGEIEKIGIELSNFNCKKVMLISGSGSIKKNKVYDQVIASLKKNKIEWKENWGVLPNPILSKVYEIVKETKEYKPDAILAAGGGSVIDTARAVAAGYYLKDAWSAYDGKEKVEKALPIFTVLTISATGTEMNPNSVITNEKENKKWALINPVIYPKVSIIDPSVQDSLPWNQTVNGAVDAFCHIIEFYFVATDEDTTLSVDEGLIRSIFRSTDSLKKDQKDYISRSNLALAATLALNGTSGLMVNKKGWSLHRIEHGVSAIYPKVAHGEGLGILFAPWAEHVWKYNEATFKRFAREVWGTTSVPDAIRMTKEKFNAWGAPTSLRQVAVDEKDLEKIADNVFIHKEFSGVKKFTKKDVMEILKKAY